MRSGEPIGTRRIPAARARRAEVSAYGAGQIFGVVILVLIVVGVVREIIKKRGGGGDDGEP